MRTSVAQGDSATAFPMLGILPGEELAGPAFPAEGASLAPVRDDDGPARASVVAWSRACSEREKVVNRLLDWADEARRQGRMRRADFLVCLAWDAYDRVPR